MSEFGCFYNPRPSPGRCIKDLRSNKVESECERVEQSCQLKKITKRTPMLITPTAKPSKKTVGQLVYQTGPQKLSGPISAYASTDSSEINSQTKSYNFFGDAHFSLANQCNTPCKDVDMKNSQLLTPPLSDQCWDMARLLTEVFNNASQKEQYVDFYLEMPYISKYRPSQKELYSVYERLGYIYKLYYIFYNCFHKLRCQYSHVRFHYVDVRLEYQTTSMPEALKTLQDLVNPQFQPEPQFITQPVTFEMFVLFNLMEAAIQVLSKKIFKNNFQSSRTIEYVDRLVKDLYYSGGQTLSGQREPKNYQLIQLYLTSDNFVEDVNNLMKSSLEGIAGTNLEQDIKNALVPQQMIVQRRGKTMHRIRAQLEALQNEGKTELANNIIEFILTKYQNAVSNIQVRQIWDKFMNIYNNLVYGKSKNLDSVQKNITELTREYKNFGDLMGLQVSGSALLMDAYTLARMFRTFPNTGHIESQKVIVYAGQAHIDIYNEFLLSLGINLIGYNPNKNKKYTSSAEHQRCIPVDISNFLL